MPRTYIKKTDRVYSSTKPQSVPHRFQAGFLALLDQRTDLARTLRANYERVVADLGGQGGLSHTRSVLIERFVCLEAILQTLEQQMAKGEISTEEMFSRWTQAINALIGLARVIGLGTVARDVFAGLYLPPPEAEGEAVPLRIVQEETHQQQAGRMEQPPIAGAGGGDEGAKG